MSFFKKILNLFGNKTFVTWFSVGIAFIIIASSALGIILPSYVSWKSYYDAAISERDYRKYLQTLPEDCLGITVTLNENVVYYDNGKASPKNSDFTVVALMTNKGVESEKILLSNEYTVLPDKGFAVNGGNVTVSYAFTPSATSDDGSEPETKIISETLTYSLEKVVPVSLTRSSLPYRVVYSNTMPFDGDGMNALVTFNDGSTELVGNDEFIYSSANLTIGTNKVGVVWSRGGTEFGFECPVTVVSEANYNDGEITAIEPAGTLYIEPDALISASKPAIRASYESGNRLLLDESKYEVAGNTTTASFTKKCILTVTLSENKTIYTRMAAVVRSGVRAENAALTNAEKVTVNETVLVDGEYVTSGEKTTVVAPTNGSTIKIDNISFDAISKPEFSVRVALRPEAARVNLADILLMRVNDTTVKITDAVLTRKDGEEGKIVFYDLNLPAAVVQKGNNELRLIFRGADSDNIYLDRIDLATGYKGKFYSTTEAYFDENTANGTAGEYAFTTYEAFGAVGGSDQMYWGHSLCSDGKYMYYLTQGGSSRSTKVYKLDLETGAQLAASATTGVGKSVEKYGGITCYDGKIIIYFDDGTTWCTASGDSFTNGCTFEKYEGFKFEGLDGTFIRDVYYNAAKEKFAVMFDIEGDAYTGLNIYDKDMKLITGTQISTSLWNGAAARRMTGSDDYIYINHTTNEKYYPCIRMYDWSANQIGSEVLLERDTEYLQNYLKNTLGVKDLNQTNTQGIAVVNGDFYVTVLKFGGANGSGSAIAKISVREPAPELLPDLNFEEYFKLCTSQGIAPNLTIEPANTKISSDGALDKNAVGYAMGGASDGKYLYLALNKSKVDSDGTAHNNASVVIKKVDAETYEQVAMSSVMDVSESVMQSDNSRLFVKDGRLYLVAGEVYSISLDEFVDNCVITKDEGMTALLTDGGNRVLKSAYWDEAQRRYILLENGYGTDNAGGDVYIVDEGGNFIEMFCPYKSGGWKTSDITSDGNYIYVLYNKTKESFVADVYGFDGLKVTSVAISGVRLSGDVNFNVQAIFFHNGNLHAGVCSWQEGHLVYHDWVVTCDASILI